MTPHEITETALAAADDRDIEVVLVVDELSSVWLRWARNAVTTAGVADDRRLTVIAFGADRTPGVVTTCGAPDRAGVEALVAAAEQARGHRDATDPDPPPVLADVTDGADRADGADRDPYRTTTVASGATVLSAFTNELAACFRTAAPAGHLLYGYAEQRTCTTYLASSTGLRRRYEDSGALLDFTARSADDTATTWTGSSAPDLSRLDPSAAHEAARCRLGSWQRPIELPAGTYEVLLSPSCVADLMLRLYTAADAREALAGRTVFAAPGGGTRIGERLTPAALTLYSDPAEPGLRCTPFTVARGSGASSVYDNGLPLTRTNWITDGVLTALVQSRQTAGSTGPVTSEIGNLVLSGGDDGPSLDAMIARTKRGLLLTSLWYLRDVDARALLLTGLTRDGVYLIEDGEIRGAVNNFRFNVSPVDVLGRVLEVGRTVPTLPREYGEHTVRVAMPALRVAGFTMSAVSDAT